ncbi:hypothetical protein AR158_c016R [Paramecium bursaria Chlorella virus AR158]|uniref:hypothetical protein n=1 Tax=Paramecium bursaria Chlorella virus AR158 TaxID=380598 RepID=UPI00015AA713|nr:hypothetical protein AR158_c016R [Paramecium bursaria Chlorella virus AR158]ABU43562.1 hypothetical protein AR158_c016R [Paramecium bursaria Chlorella virus AR158]
MLRLVIHPDLSSAFETQVLLLRNLHRDVSRSEASNRRSFLRRAVSIRHHEVDEYTMYITTKRECTIFYRWR